MPHIHEHRPRSGQYDRRLVRVLIRRRARHVTADATALLVAGLDGEGEQVPSVDGELGGAPEDLTDVHDLVLRQS